MKKIFESKMLEVWHDNDGHIHIGHKETKHVIRIRDYLDDIIITTSGCNLIPTNVNGIMGVKTQEKQTPTLPDGYTTCKICGAIIPILTPCPNCDSGF